MPFPRPQAWEEQRKHERWATSCSQHPLHTARALPSSRLCVKAAGETNSSVPGAEHSGFLQHLHPIKELRPDVISRVHSFHTLLP